LTLEIAVAGARSPAAKGCRFVPVRRSPSKRV
jgi:hypothetical protein